MQKVQRCGMNRAAPGRLLSERGDIAQETAPQVLRRGLALAPL